MSESMVERVARAICSSVGKEPDAPFKDRSGKAMDFPEWERWQGEARAAIEAMREPTHEIFMVGREFAMGPREQDAVKERWRRLIEHEESFEIQDSSGVHLAYVYYCDDPIRREMMKRLTKDDARRMARQILRLPELVRMAKGQTPE